VPRWIGEKYSRRERDAVNRMRKWLRPLQGKKGLKHLEALRGGEEGPFPHRGGKGVGTQGKKKTSTPPNSSCCVYLLEWWEEEALIPLLRGGERD